MYLWYVIGKKKKAAATTSETDAVPSTESVEQVAQLEDEVVEETPAPVSDDGTVLSVTVHSSGHLQSDIKYMAHPLVRVSVVNPITGEYWQKSDA